jgi:hypothetical protein
MWCPVHPARRMTETPGSDRPISVPLKQIHLIPGRARFRLSKPLPREELEGLIERVAAVAGVSHVVARPNTGSVIVKFDGSAEALLSHLTDSGAVRLVDPPKPPPVGQAAQLGLMRLDMDIKRRTDDGLDFRTAVALLLVFAAIVQLARGKVAGPTTTLLMSALSLLSPPKSG